MANRKELIDAIAVATGKTKKDSKAALEAILTTMKSALASGEDVKLVNFGTFKVVERKARKGRNPRTGEALDIPAKKVVRFKSGKELKEAADYDKE
jgi:nucleoid DNA-binding protein